MSIRKIGLWITACAVVVVVGIILILARSDEDELGSIVPASPSVEPSSLQGALGESTPSITP